MDPEQTAPTALGPHCCRNASKHSSRRQKQTTFVLIGALKINIKGKDNNS